MKNEFVEEIIKKVLHNKDNSQAIVKYDASMIKKFLQSCIEVCTENILTSEDKEIHIEQFMIYYYTYKMLLMGWNIQDLFVELILINKENMSLMMDIKDEYDGNLYQCIYDFLDEKDFY